MGTNNKVALLILSLVAIGLAAAFFWVAQENGQLGGNQASVVNTTDISWRGNLYRRVVEPSAKVKIFLSVDLSHLGPRTQDCVTRIFVGIDGQLQIVVAEKPVTKLIFEVARGQEHKFGLTAEHKFANPQPNGENSRGLFYNLLKLMAVQDQEVTVYFDTPAVANLDLLGDICSK